MFPGFGGFGGGFGAMGGGMGGGLGLGPLPPWLKQYGMPGGQGFGGPVLGGMLQGGQPMPQGPGMPQPQGGQQMPQGQQQPPGLPPGLLSDGGNGPLGYNWGGPPTRPRGISKKSYALMG